MNLLRWICLWATVFTTSHLWSAEEEFTSNTIDIGIVVADIEASAKFYTAAIGFTELNGFSVPADFATEAGLTDGHPLKIRVFALGTGSRGTKIKLMQLPEVESKKSDNTYIHSQLGISYLTIYVKDTNTALKRLKQAGVKTLGKSPSELDGGVFLTLFRDPDGNVIELVGPRG